MGDQILLVVVLTVSVAGMSLLWRRVGALSEQVRVLRSSLEQIRAENAQGAISSPMHLRQPNRAEEAQAIGEFDVAGREAASAASAIQLDFLADIASPEIGGADDPFDDAWVIKKPPHPAAKPAPRAENVRVQQALASAFAPELAQPARAQDQVLAHSLWPTWTHLRWVGFVALMLAPFIALGLRADGLSLALAVAAFSFAFWLSGQFRTLGLAWVSTVAAAAWSLWAIGSGLAQTLPLSTSGGLAYLGAVGLAHAVFEQNWRPGAALAAVMTAALAVLAQHFGVISPQGAAAAVLIGVAATIGASSPRLDALHLIGFIGAGLLLFFLSGQDQAKIWFTPAMGWTAACFLGLAAARAPVLGPQGALVAATGCLAPLFVIGGLLASGHGLNAAWACPTTFAILGVLIAGILSLSARSAGSVSALSLTGWILGGGAFAAIAAAALLAMPLNYAGLAFAPLALGLVLMHWRTQENLFLCGAAVATCLTLVGAIAALSAYNGSIDPISLAFLVAFGMATPALILAATAFVLSPGAPATRIVLEIGAGACGVLALSALVRALFTRGTPAAFPIGLAELGAHALTWSLLSLALLRYGQGGARDARVAAAGALVSVAAAAALIGVALWLFGAWTPGPARLSGLAEHAPLGFAAMATGAWLHWDFWRRRDNPLRDLAAFAAACLLTAAWISLEFTWIRSNPSNAVDWPSLWLSGVLLMIAFALIVRRYLKSARS